MADYPNRLELGESGDGVKDDFPDAQLFRINVVNSTDVDSEPQDKWINNMLCFLITGLPLEVMS